MEPENLTSPLDKLMCGILQFLHKTIVENTVLGKLRVMLLLQAKEQNIAFNSRNNIDLMKSQVRLLHHCFAAKTKACGRCNVSGSACPLKIHFSCDKYFGKIMCAFNNEYLTMNVARKA